MSHFVVPGFGCSIGGDHTLVVAEIGKNFITTPLDQSVATYLGQAKALVRAAKEAGADAVKFQTHTVDDEQLNVHVVSPHFRGADRYRWVSRNTNATPLDSFWRPLQEYCAQLGILFHSTPMSRGAAQKLATLDVPMWKVGSGDILDFVMLDHLASTGKPILLSTGMSTLEEIDCAVDFLQRRHVTRLALYHCVSRYPCPPEDLHLATISFLRERYNLPVGFSDHSIGIESALAAVAFGAEAIEKHFSFSRDFWGSDHKVSLTPPELAALVVNIRGIERDPNMRARYLKHDATRRATQSGVKVLQPEESVFRGYFRKALVAAEDIPMGTRLTAVMVAAMRPQAFIRDGIPSERYEEILGRVTTVDLRRYDPITTQVVELERVASAV